MRARLVVAAVCAAVVAVAAAGAALSASPNKTVVVYDDFSSGNNAKWNNPYGPGELGSPDADHFESFAGGVERVRAVPFRTGYDYSVYDHLKYMEVSNSTFPVSPNGSLAFSADMSAGTPGTVDGLIQQGIYGPSGTWTDPSSPPTTPN
jgi:opacity protein-like surface antigen